MTSDRMERNEHYGIIKYMVSKIDKIGIIGCGALGQALAASFKKAGITTLCYDTNSDKSTVDSIEALVQDSEVIIIATPSWAVLEVVEKIAKCKHALAANDKIVVAMSKGVEQNFITMDEVMTEELHGLTDYGVLFGPMFADEILDGMGGYGVLAATDKKWFDLLFPVFRDSNIILTYVDDMHAAALCSVLKNIYAIGFGIAAASGWGMNFHGHLAALSLNEMRQILKILGISDKIVSSDVGIGDLITTGFSSKSYNHKIGAQIAKGVVSDGLKSEGLLSLSRIHGLIDCHKFPVLIAIYNIVYKKADIQSLHKL